MQGIGGAPRSLRLCNGQSPGDIVMLTAAVRDLHEAWPHRYVTDVRTPCPDLWAGNPFVTPVDAPDLCIECEYPLVHSSNDLPYHFVHGFRKHLEEKLAISIPASAGHGDIYLQDRNMSRRHLMRILSRGASRDANFWLINAGGKYDFTAKWWAYARYQEVVDRLSGEVAFVQVGADGHAHPPLAGVVNLVGRTSIDDLKTLLYHARGVICPVTFVMHLAAAIRVSAVHSGSCPCVVIAGGREPSQWEAYPGHHFLHTIGLLDCCALGGCWKSRVFPLGDCDEKDGDLCVDVVDGLPRCMDMISVDTVMQHVLMVERSCMVKL